MAGTVAGLFVPLGALDQFVGERLSVDCSVKPGVGGVHQNVAQQAIGIRDGEGAVCVMPD